MGIADRLKDLTDKAESTAAEHKEQIQQAVQKAGAAADQRTGGQYHEQIEKAGAKVEGFLAGLAQQPGVEGGEPKAPDDATPPADAPKA
jgi:hypothetical protein